MVGQGYVGLPLALRAVEAGFDVVGFDLDAHRVKQLAAGQLATSRTSPTGDWPRRWPPGRYEPTDDPDRMAGFDVAVIDVPTPLREGVPNLSFVEDAAGPPGRPPAARGHGGARVDQLSRAPPRSWSDPILEDGSGLLAGRDFHLGYSPERIDPGNPDWRLENTPKVVSGVDDDSLAAVRAFYDRIVDRTVPVSGTREAELTKLLENTFRHVNIALVNELAMFAAELGIDVWEAIDAASTKPFGYLRFTPGPGVGGHCLPIDPSYLSWKVRRTLGQPFRFVELANDVNEHMPDYVVRRLLLAFNRLGRTVNGSRILLLGLAYKRNTGDAREAPGTVIAQAAGRAGGRGAGGRPPPPGRRGALPAGRAHRRGARGGRRCGARHRPRRLRLRPGPTARRLRPGHPEPT